METASGSKLHQGWAFWTYFTLSWWMSLCGLHRGQSSKKAFFALCSTTYYQNAPPFRSLGFNSSKGSRYIEQPPFWTIIEAAWLPNQYCMSKMLPIGEVLASIGQPGAEILRSLCFVLLSLFPPYVWSWLSFWGYLLTYVWDTSLKLSLIKHH